MNCRIDASTEGNCSSASPVQPIKFAHTFSVVNSQLVTVPPWYAFSRTHSSIALLKFLRMGPSDSCTWRTAARFNDMTTK